MIRCERIIRKCINSDLNMKNHNVQIKLDPTDIEVTISQAINIFREEPTLLRINAPITVVGDLHGQFSDLLQYFSLVGPPPDNRYLFLGDYVDRGKNSVETFSLLISLKAKYPKHIFLLRGNHETEEMTKTSGFYDECIDKFSLKLYKKFISVFDMLPIAAIIKDRIFCVHGGLSPDLKSLSDIENLKRPLQVQEEGLLMDLLWSDPSEIPGFQCSERGISFTYGKDVAERFIKENHFDMICRAHQFVDGHKFSFENSQSVLTIFSASNYCNCNENKGAVLMVDDKLNCSFKVLQPRKIRQNQPLSASKCFFQTIEEIV